QAVHPHPFAREMPMVACGLLAHHPHSYPCKPCGQQTYYGIVEHVAMNDVWSLVQHTPPEPWQRFQHAAFAVLLVVACPMCMETAPGHLIDHGRALLGHKQEGVLDVPFFNGPFGEPGEVGYAG